MACNSLCSTPKYIQQFGIRSYVVGGNNKYSEGWKRCTPCAIVLKTEGIFCPCCNNRLKRSPATSQNKRNFLEETKIKRY